MFSKTKVYKFQGVAKNYMRRVTRSNVYNKASLARIFAKFIDILISFLCSLFLGKLGLCLGLSYLMIADSLFNGESFGKKVLGLRVISLIDAESCTFKQSFVRNLPVFAPLVFTFAEGWGGLISFLTLIPIYSIEIYLIIDPKSYHRMGDILAETTVIGNDPTVEINSNLHMQRANLSEQSMSSHLHSV